MNDIEQASQIVLVTNVISRLALMADFGTLEEYGALLDKDVVWEFPGVGDVDLPTQIRHGKTDALEGARERRESGIQGPGTHTLHVVTNVSVNVSDGTATSMAYWHFVTELDKTPRIRASGVYRDRFIRQAHDWLLAHRRISQS